MRPSGSYVRSATMPCWVATWTSRNTRCSGLRLVDRRAAAGGVHAVDGSAADATGVGGGEAEHRRFSSVTADRAHASSTVSPTSARAQRPAASASATSACTTGRSASVCPLPWRTLLAGEVDELVAGRAGPGRARPTQTPSGEQPEERHPVERSVDDRVGAPNCTHRPSGTNASRTS